MFQSLLSQRGSALGCKAPLKCVNQPCTRLSACGRQKLVCKALGEENGTSFVNGPIQIGASLGLVGDQMKSDKPVDRSKGLWTRCDKCGVILYIKHLKEHHHICFGCNHHLKMSSRERVDHLIDPGTWRPLDETLSPVDPLEFTDMKAYTDRLKEAQDKTGLQDAVRTGTGLLHGIPVALGVMDFGFMGGSMGSVVGEKLTRLIEYATQQGMALIIICTSGGARMQEGILSLMQMAKISGALHIHQNCAKLMYIAILTSPTTGGVTASFGMLGDFIIAEPQAIIGFAGRRVIEQTLQEQLPDDFQTAEYLLEHGLLDLVIPRSFLKGALYEVLDFYKDAPFKERGSIPFGIQRGTYLAGEERIRRQLAEWSHTQGNGSSPSPLAVASKDLVVAPSGSDSKTLYTDLVDSFRMLSGSESAGTPDDRALAEALALAKNGAISWTVNNTEPANPQYMVRYSTA